MANAQVSDSLKAFITADDPNTLEYWYTHDSECPWAEEEAKSVIEGVIKRSRIKTEHGTGGPNNVYLNNIARCLEANVGGHVAFFNIMFGDYGARGSLLFEKPYGGILTMPSKQFGLESLKSLVEGAVTDFVEVNFLSESY